MKLSVVIPNLHSPALGQTLAALAGQTWLREQTEVVVVGLDRYGYTAHCPWARLLDTGSPVSASQARNLGIQATSGDVIVFVDSDGVPAPDWLARYAAWFADPRVTVVGGGIAFSWDEPYWTVCDNVSRFYAQSAASPAGERSNLATLNMAIRRSALYQVGLFDATTFTVAGEDTDLSLRLRKAGHRLLFDPAIVVEHRQHRATWRAMWQVAWAQGYYSVKVQPRYAATEGLPRPLRQPFLLRLASPAVAAATTFNIYRQRPGLRQRWVWPGVWLAKLAWCWGAAKRLAQPY